MSAVAVVIVHLGIPSHSRWSPSWWTRTQSCNAIVQHCNSVVMVILCKWTLFHHFRGSLRRWTIEGCSSFTRGQSLLVSAGTVSGCECGLHHNWVPGGCRGCCCCGVDRMESEDSINTHPPFAHRNARTHRFQLFTWRWWWRRAAKSPDWNACLGNWNGHYVMRAYNNNVVSVTYILSAQDKTNVCQSNAHTTGAHAGTSVRTVSL